MMLRLKFLPIQFIWVLLAVSMFSWPCAANTLIYAGHLLDVLTGRYQTEVTVRVAEGKVTAIDNGFTTPRPQDRVIDLKTYYVLPGLMDMHTHLSSQYSAKAYLERFQLGEADRALLAAAHAQLTLDAGFTTVRDLGDSYNVTVALRKAIAQGRLPGPRIYTAAKSIATTGGHADPSNGSAGRYQFHPGPELGVINGPDEAREAVRQRYKDGADWIKITATGGVLSVAKSGDNPQFTDAELEALIATANDYNMGVAAHAHGAAGMKRAVVAGVKSVEHGTYMNKEIMRLMKKQGTYYVPTLLAGAWVAEKAEVDGFFPKVVRPKARAIGPKIQATFAEAYKAGVNIAFGTDSGVSEHGRNGEEFALMVAAGMPAAEAIRAATVDAARLLNEEQRLGQIKPGFYADIVAVKTDPLRNINVLETIAFVMKGGAVWRGVPSQ